MDIEKMMEYLKKKWSYISQNQVDDWLIKKLGDSKIDNVKEYRTLQLLSSTYHSFYMASYIEVMDKEYNARNILELLDKNFVFCSKMPLCKEEIVGEWFIECEQLKQEVENYLKKFLLHSNEKELYTKAISKMESYCKKHEVDYEEWKTELNKYKNGEKKEMFFGFGIAIGIWLLCLSMMLYRQQSLKQNEIEIIDEQENIDETSLEEIDVEQILMRKL